MLPGLSTSIRGAVTEVPITGLEQPSVIVANLVQTLAWKERKAKKIDKASPDAFRETLTKLLPRSPMGQPPVLLRRAMGHTTSRLQRKLGKPSRPLGHQLASRLFALIPGIFPKLAYALSPKHEAWASWSKFERLMEEIMQPAFDTLSAFRKLEQARVPKAQAEATIEVMNDATTYLVTKEYLTVELGRLMTKLDERFDKIDERFDKIDERFARIDERFGRIDERFGKVEKSIAGLDAKHETNLARSQKFMMATILGTSLTIVAMQFATLLVVLGPLLTAGG